jgi:hypothetical protein
MKQANTKNRKELQLARRLVLVRTTIRELRPNQLAAVQGGIETVKKVAEPDWPTGCPIIYTM